MTDQHTKDSLRRASDDELVVALRAGSPFALSEIHHRYHDALLAYARKILGGAHHDAEEIVQDVYIKAYRALRADPEREIALRPWLYAIARNRALDQMRRPQHSVPLGDDALGLVAFGSDPVSLINRRERMDSLVGHINDLPTRQRKALVMFELEDHSHSSIGRALNVTTGASKALVCRARGALSSAD
jgi:RNA polymerase sigma-70 factor (ECF subfamily)